MRRRLAFHIFTIAGYEREEAYLRRMHNKGWKFTGLYIPGIYQFERCQPEDVIYQLDYNLNGMPDREYTQLFEDCGWEYLQDFCGYSYFRKPASQMNEEEKIFSDSKSRLDMLDRVFRGRVVTLIILLLGVIIPQLLMQLSSSTHYNRPILIIYSVMFFIYLFVFIKFAYMYFQCKRRNS